MSLYIGISNDTGELVIGEMYEEIKIQGGEKSVTLAIFDFESFDFHPVEACIRLFSDEPYL